MLAESGWQHQVDDRRQGIERGLGHLLRQLDLRGGEHRLWVEQVEDGFGFGHRRLADQLQHHALHRLFAKWYSDQMPRAELSLQFGGQRIVEESRDRRDVDRDSGVHQKGL